MARERERKYIWLNHMHDVYDDEMTHLSSIVHCTHGSRGPASKNATKWCVYVCCVCGIRIPNAVKFTERIIHTSSEFQSHYIL